MGDEEEPKLSPRARQVLGKTRVPHKFCPYCGTRNEASADVCENCGKNIAWIKVPEPTPYTETPKEEPRLLPEQRKPFNRRTIVIILIILALILIAVLILIFTIGRGKGATAAVPLAAAFVPCMFLPSTSGCGWPSCRSAKGVADVAVSVLRERGP
jgi:predicted nucleic acid-binding Zn ribbon protein